MAERLTLLLQRVVAWRDDRRVAQLLKAAKLKVSLITTLAGGGWRRRAGRAFQADRERLGYIPPGACTPPQRVLTDAVLPSTIRLKRPSMIAEIRR